jgi:hypothetical protein
MNQKISKKESFEKISSPNKMKNTNKIINNFSASKIIKNFLKIYQADISCFFPALKFKGI